VPAAGSVRTTVPSVPSCVYATLPTV
jgi:hypothetical protein